MSAILLRFRIYNYGIATDIEKAFHHLHLHECERDFTRFLWLSDPNNPDSPFDTYRFKAAPFGTTSSPFMLNATLQKHLNQFSTPVAHDMKDNMYVDNILSGSDTEVKATQHYDEARSIMNEAKFNLRSWASNSPLLQQKAIEDGIADASPQTGVNILGLRWNTSTDTIHFPTKKSLPIDCSLVTKREVLQHSSSVFDPLGILAPVTIRAETFMQQLWQQSIDWDEPLNEQLHQEWLNIAKDLEAAQQTIIPRRYHSISRNDHQNPTQLHVFVDSSKRAYSAVGYLLQNS